MSFKVLQEEVELSGEAREMAHIRENKLKQRIDGSLKKESWHYDVPTSNHHPRARKAHCKLGRTISSH